MVDESEAERLELVAEVHSLADELSIYSGSVRLHLVREPERAARVLRHAIASRAALRSPASYAIARFRSGYDSPAAPEREATLDLRELEAALERAIAWGAPSVALSALQEAIERES